MGRRPKVGEAIIDRVRALAVTATLRCERAGTEPTHPSIEDVMEGLVTTTEEARCLKLWKEAYPLDSRRRQLSQWGITQSRKGPKLGRGEVRILLPDAAMGDWTPGNPGRVAIARVTRLQHGREVPDERFPRYAILIRERAGGTGQLEVRLLASP